MRSNFAITYLLLIILIGNIVASNSAIVAQSSEGNQVSNNDELKVRSERMLLMAKRAFNFTQEKIIALAIKHNLTLPDEVNATLAQAKDVLVLAEELLAQGNYTGAIRLAVKAMSTTRRALMMVLHLLREKIKTKEGRVSRAEGLSVAINRTRAFLERLERLAEANIANEIVLEAIRANITKAMEILDKAESALEEGDVNTTARLLGEARRNVSGLIGLIMRYAYAYKLREQTRQYLKAVLNMTSNLVKLTWEFKNRLLRLNALRTLNQTLLPRLIQLHHKLLNDTLGRLALIEVLVKTGNISDALKQLTRIKANLLRIRLLKNRIPKIRREVEKLELKNSTEGVKNRLEKLKKELDLAKKILKEKVRPEIYKHIEEKLNETLDILDELEELIEEGNITEAREKLKELLAITHQLLKDAKPLIEKAKKIAPLFWKKLRNATSELVSELQEIISELKDEIHELIEKAESLKDKISKIEEKLEETPSSHKKERLKGKLRMISHRIETSLKGLRRALKALEDIEDKLNKNAIGITVAKLKVETIKKSISLIASTIAELSEEIEEIASD